MTEQTHHHTEVVETWDPPMQKKAYRAFCQDCSWFSRDHETERDAEDDGDEHAIAMAQVDD